MTILAETIKIISTDRKNTYEVNKNTIKEQNVSSENLIKIADMYQKIDSYMKQSKGVYDKQKLKELSLKAKEAELELQKLWNFASDETKLKYCYIIYPRNL